MTHKKNSSRRHCMVVLAYYPLAETRVQREAEALVAHGDEVDVICLASRQGVSQARYRDVQAYHLPVRLKKDNILSQLFNYLHFFILAAVKLAQLHRRQPYDVVQVHNLPDFLVFCALIPKLDGVPIILDLHDLMPEFYAGRFGTKGGSSLFERLVRWQERLACSFADHVITVSEHWRQTLIKRGVPAHKCSVVMNVADENVFRLPENNIPRLSRNSELRLIYHGITAYRCGLDLALRAIAQVRHDLPHIHLTIRGDGDFLDALIQITQELDLNNHVTFDTDFCPLEELPKRILAAANLGIVPYRNDIFTDGIVPTKLMEYAALGLPAIAARTSAIEAYFSDTMVEFFEPGDVDDLARCIRKLYSNRNRLVELAQGTEKFNQRYNWTKVSTEYVTLVERLRSKS